MDDPVQNGTAGSRQAWAAWQAAERRLAEIDQQRRAALDERNRLHAEVVRLGKLEGWHV